MPPKRCSLGKTTLPRFGHPPRQRLFGRSRPQYVLWCSGPPASARPRRRDLLITRLSLPWYQLDDATPDVATLLLPEPGRCRAQRRQRARRALLTP